MNLRDGDRVVAVTSTDVDGTFTLPAAPGSYTVKIDLSAFASIERPVTVGQPPCEAVVDAKLSLVSRVPGYVAPPPTPQTASGRGAVDADAPAGAAGARGFGGPGGRAGGGGGRFGGANRFQALTVEQSAGAAATPETGPDVVVAGGDDPAARLLPPGFSLERAAGISDGQRQHGRSRSQSADRSDSGACTRRLRSGGWSAGRSGAGRPWAGR